MSHSLQVFYPIKDKSALDGALSKIEKPVAVIANFTNTKPIMLIGEAVG